MTPRLYTYVATAILAAALSAWGTWSVQAWRYGAKEAKRLQVAQVAEEARQTDAKQQRQFNDQTSGKHARQVATLNKQLGDSRAQNALLSDRQCLDAGTVRMLNAIGKTPAPTRGLRAPAGQSDGAAAAVAGSGNDASPGYAGERATADHIAQCRAGYAQLSDQLGKIIDIEERRQGRAP
ncbi:MAG: hypothetical protein F9K35_00700 [Burkholderiaceae bacterium]|nr:MAG: hypothetical protein F9K35_00700 [Burkholderiaceae bacterium]